MKKNSLHQSKAGRRRAAIARYARRVAAVWVAITAASTLLVASCAIFVVPKVAHGASPPVLRQGQNILLQGVGSCADKAAAVDVAMTHTTKGIPAANVVYARHRVENRCGEIDFYYGRVGKRIYAGAVDVVEILDGSHVTFYLLTDQPWEATWKI